MSKAMTVSASKPNLGRFGSFGIGVTPQQAKERGPGLRGNLGRQFAAGRIVLGGAYSGSHDDAAGGHRNRQHLDGARQTGGRVVPPHRKDYPGRFLLGIGVGHREIINDYRKPYEALVEYLDKLDEYGVPANRRVLGAQGPRVLKLSAERSGGAFPYQTTPEHTAHARELLGPSAFLAAELKVVLTTDADEARAVGGKGLDMYFNLVNFRNSWKRQGFSEEEVVRPGSDRLVDALVAYGTVDQIAARLKEHLDAGADHVAVEVLTEDENLVSALAELAGPLALTQR